MPPQDPALPAPRPLRFVHRGELVELPAVPPTRSLLNWLREDARCTGTKEGCNEGDCGACTVLIAEPADPPQPGRPPRPDVVDGLRLRPVNACLVFLPAVDGKAVITVEDLQGPGFVDEATDPSAHPAPGVPPATACPPGACAGRGVGGLHPVQRAVADGHGSQCGFCTPGFVMTLTALYEHRLAAARAGALAAAEAADPAPLAPAREAIADALAGNLCRCTGYRPLLDAGAAMFTGAVRRLDTAALRARLAPLAADPPLHHVHPAGTAHAPRDLAALAALREARPGARLVAGASDVALWVTKQHRALPEIILTGACAELRASRPAPVPAFTEADDGPDPLPAGHPGWWLGAALTLEDAWGDLAARHPALTEMWRRFAAPPVRHAGTLGGNVANGSPIGDGPPVLMALDARVVLRRGERRRVLPLDRFYLAYQRSRLEAGEFLEALWLPDGLGGTLRAWKSSKRFDCDISAVSAGLRLALDGGGRVQDLRLAFGGLAGTVARATRAEAALRGAPWTGSALRAAQAALAEDFRPLDDLRASAGHRLRIARAFLQRLWLETRPDAPLPAHALRVGYPPARAAGAPAPATHPEARA
jgi:xanthine dehydrogenase small subunit